MDDPAELSVARYAAHIADLALWASVASAALTGGLLVLELRRRLDEGVKLAITVMTDAQIYGGVQQDSNTYLAVMVTNRDSAATTLTHLLLYDYPTRWGRWLPSRWPWLNRRMRRHRAKTMMVTNPGQQPLPYLLEPGRNWHGMAEHTPELTEIINRGRRFVGILGSHSNRTLLRRVRRWKPPADLTSALPTQE